ncbi:MAG: response regulator [Thioalkalispiraceae bacterium]|jgi:CheY-like chemotaxis protein
MKTALVVDDDPVSLVFVKAILRENNFHVVEGRNGVEAISQFVATRPSLLVIDLNMPVIDGCIASNIIRTVQGGDECIIVLFTSELQEEISSRYNCASVNHVVDRKNVDQLRKLIGDYSTATDD